MDILSPGGLGGYPCAVGMAEQEGAGHSCHICARGLAELGSCWCPPPVHSLGRKAKMFRGLWVAGLVGDGTQEASGD